MVSTSSRLERGTGWPLVEMILMRGHKNFCGSDRSIRSCKTRYLYVAGISTLQGRSVVIFVWFNYNRILTGKHRKNCRTRKRGFVLQRMLVLVEDCGSRKNKKRGIRTRAQSKRGQRKQRAPTLSLPFLAPTTQANDFVNN